MKMERIAWMSGLKITHKCICWIRDGPGNF